MILSEPTREKLPSPGTPDNQLGVAGLTPPTADAVRDISLAIPVSFEQIISDPNIDISLVKIGFRQSIKYDAGLPISEDWVDLTLPDGRVASAPKAVLFARLSGVDVEDMEIILQDIRIDVQLDSYDRMMAIRKAEEEQLRVAREKAEHERNIMLERKMRMQEQEARDYFLGYVDIHTMEPGEAIDIEPGYEEAVTRLVSFCEDTYLGGEIWVDDLTGLDRPSEMSMLGVVNDSLRNALIDADQSVPSFNTTARSKRAEVQAERKRLEMIGRQIGEISLCARLTHKAVRTDRLVLIEQQAEATNNMVSAEFDRKQAEASRIRAMHTGNDIRARMDTLWDLKQDVYDIVYRQSLENDHEPSEMVFATEKEVAVLRFPSTPEEASKLQTGAYCLLRNILADAENIRGFDPQYIEGRTRLYSDILFWLGLAESVLRHRA